MISTVFFSLGCLVALVVVYRAYLAFREEIVHLPQAGHSNGIPHALLGVSLKAAIGLPAHVHGRPTVVQFASPTCPKCHDEMVALERAHKVQPFSYVCLYEVDPNHLEEVQQFVAEFQHMNLQPLKLETARKLGVNMSPLVAMIDADGVVRRVEFRLPRILQSMPADERWAG